jgi:hypothetical protein
MRLLTCHMERQTVSDPNPKGFQSPLEEQMAQHPPCLTIKCILQVQPLFKLQLSVIGKNCDLLEPQNA